MRVYHVHVELPYPDLELPRRFEMHAKVKDFEIAKKLMSSFLKHCATQYGQFVARIDVKTKSGVKTVVRCES